MKLNIQTGEPKRADVLWSPQQQAIFTELQTGAQSLCIEAVAGSGKTTTIVEGMNYIPRSKRNIFVAFNKSIADELKGRVPSHIEAKTLHSLCNTIIRCSASAKVKMDKFKNSTMLEDYLELVGADKEYFYEIKGQVDIVLKLLKANCLGPIDEDDVLEVSSNCGIVLDGGAVDCILAIWDLLHEDDNKYWNTMDFDDMLRIPLMRGYPFPQYDNVFVDEAQDLNLVQHCIIKKILAPGGRVIAVGDSHQAIYAFRGAQSNSMELLRETFGMKELPLNTTYRCPHVLTEHARTFNHSITTFPEQRRGKLEVKSSSFLSSYEYRGEGEIMVLCRRNAPLVKAAMQFVKNGVPIHLMGRNLVPMIVNTASKVRNTFGSLSSYNIQQFRRVQAEGKKEHQIRALTDITDVIHLCREELGVDVKTRGLQNFLYTLFPREKPSNSHITLCTIHKSKGLEADDVYIIQPQLLPFVVGGGDKQEENLHYVAITRAKYSLFYLDSELKMCNDLIIPKY